MFSIADNIQNVRKRIQKATNDATREIDAVQLLAVTKTRSAEVLHQAMMAGLNCFGENYLNEALAKQVALRGLCPADQYNSLIWHFIGPIQSNKTKAIAENFDWVHSVDRLKIAQRLNDQRLLKLDALNICIQVNVDEEDSKSGVLLTEVDAFAAELAKFPRLKLRGLMCIPNAQQGESGLKESFLKMKMQFKKMQAEYPDLTTLSMGMSGDIELAIECGSTLVRVGTSLFGARE